MITTTFLKVLFCVTAILLQSCAHSNPIDPMPANKSAEVGDLNSGIITSVTQNSIEKGTFLHHDEDSTPFPEVSAVVDESADVEILEEPQFEKQVNEIEEQFRGAAIKSDTDNFVEENIEMGPESNDRVSYLFLNIMVVVIAFVAVFIYAVVVIWRMRVEERYGTLPLLVNILDEDYLQDNHNSLHSDKAKRNGSNGKIRRSSSLQ